MEKQLDEIRFIREVDKLKSVLRQSSLYDGSRRENSAEHSWQLALAVFMFRDLADFPIDVERAMKMALVHDIVEIDAGDTFVYDTHLNDSKSEKEKAAAERIFSMLPSKKSELMGLWEAYEKQECPESKYLAALDRFLPVLAACEEAGGSWKRHNISLARVIERNQGIEHGSKKLWGAARAMIDKCFAENF